MDFKTFFEQNKKACVGGLAGVTVVLLGVAAITGHNSGTTVETTADASTTAETSASVATTAVDFYSKLSAGEPVSLLIIGDGFSSGNNLDDYSKAWAELISTKLHEEFSSEVTIDNYALPSSNTAYSGYVIANELPDGSEYDAVILSFGNYDTPDNFGTFYEGMVRALVNKCPGISIISLIEPSSVTNPDGYSDDNASAIQSITDNYNGITVDIAKLMQDNGSDVSATAASDMINQNEEGNAATADIILSSIKTAVNDNIGHSDSNIDSINDISALDDYAYIPVADFAKVDDTTFAIPADYITDVDGNVISGLLGIDYNYLPGSNDVYVTSDGTPFGRHTVEFDGTESEQHIVLINDNFEPTDHVTISFASADEANSFAGMIVTGNVELPASYDTFEPKEITEPTTETLLTLLGEDTDEDIVSEGGPGSESDDTSADVPADGDTKYVDGVLYEYYQGDWYEVINDDTGNPDMGVKSQVVATRSANEVITNKESVHSSENQAADVTEAAVSTEGSVEAGTEAASETAVESTAVSKEAATEAETTAPEATESGSDSGFVNPGEAQAAAGNYSINETDANGNVVGSVVETY